MKTYEAAHGKWPGILKALGLDDRTLSGKNGPCPLCGGKDRFMFDDKEGRGTYICRQCGAGVGLDLVMAWKGTNYADACRAVDAVVGNVTVQVKAPETNPGVRLKRVASELIQIGGSVAAYLAARGLPLPARSVKRHPSMPYYDNGKRIANYEAMCSLFVNSEGKPLTYHVTYLQGDKKAPVNPAKKILPPVEPMRGGAIRLSAATDTVAIAEGIETALAFQSLTGIPTWAATSATLLEQFVPPAGITHVVIAGDCDDNAVGQAAAYGLAKRLAAAGIGYTVRIPTHGDWADVIADSRSESA